MRPDLAVCPNSSCDTSRPIGVHSLKERRYKCHACGKTFAETSGIPLFGLKHALWLVLIVLALLANGCPVPAIVFAFGLDERTVADGCEPQTAQAAPAPHRPERPGACGTATECA
jgi:transposase-like protein